MRQPICKWFLLVAPLAICVSIGLHQDSMGAEEDNTPGAPRLLPKDTLAYIRIDNVDDMRSDMADSSMGRMMSDPKLKPFVGEVYTTLADLFEQFGSQIGLSLEELLAIPTGQVAAAAMPADTARALSLSTFCAPLRPYTTDHHLKNNRANGALRPTPIPSTIPTPTAA